MVNERFIPLGRRGIMAQLLEVHGWSAEIQVGSRCCRRKQAFWVCAAYHEDERYSRKGQPPKQDLYALLGISPDASSQEIKLAFRKLARQYHPDVNRNFGAAEIFKRIHVAYETLADKASREDYDHSLRVQAHAARKKTIRNNRRSSMYARRTHSRRKQARDSYWKTEAGEGMWEFDSSEDMWEFNSIGSVGQGTYREFYDSHTADEEDSGCEKDSESYAKCRGPSFLRQGWEDSTINVLIVFCLVGFIWHALGVQLALTYFVFFIPHHKEEHTAWYRFASLLAWLIGGTKGLALQYGIVTTGWLYGKGHDLILAFILFGVWMEGLLPHAFYVPHGAVLLMAHLWLGGFLPH